MDISSATAKIKRLESPATQAHNSFPIKQTNNMKPPRLTALTVLCLCREFAERCVRSPKEECLSRLIFLSEQYLRTTLATFVEYYRHRRNHQGIASQLIELPENLPNVGRNRG